MKFFITLKGNFCGKVKMRDIKYMHRPQKGSYNRSEKVESRRVICFSSFFQLSAPFCAFGYIRLYIIYVPVNIVKFLSCKILFSNFVDFFCIYHCGINDSTFLLTTVWLLSKPQITLNYSKTGAMTIVFTCCQIAQMRIIKNVHMYIILLM